MKNKSLLITSLIIATPIYTDEPQPHKAIDNVGDAIEWHQKKIQLNQTEEEVYSSKLEVAHILKELGMRVNIVIKAYEDAINFAPHRLEATYYLSELCNKHTKYSKAYQILKEQQNLPQHITRKTFSGGEWIHEYGLLFQLSISSHQIGQYEESLAICNLLLKREDLPTEWRALTSLRVKKLMGI